MCYCIYLYLQYKQQMGSMPARERDREYMFVRYSASAQHYYVIIVWGTCFGRCRYSYVRDAFLCLLQVLMRTRIASAAAKAWRTAVNHWWTPYLDFNLQRVEMSCDHACGHPQCHSVCKLLCIQVVPPRKKPKSALNPATSCNIFWAATPFVEARVLAVGVI